MRFFKRKPDKLPARPSVRGQKGNFLRTMFSAALGDRLNASWTTTVYTADQMIYNNLESLRARARDQYANNDYVKRFAGLVRNNVVGGSGIKYQCKVLDNSGKPDELVRNAIEQRWRDFCETEQHGLDFIELQGLAINTLIYDGEVFLIEHSAGDFNYGLEMLDAHHCDVKLNKELQAGRYVRFGIEYDRNHRPTAYYFKLPSSQSPIHHDWRDKYTRIPAERVRHLFVKEWAGQKRGLPWIATGLQRLKMLSAYEDAALVAARVGASKMGFFSNNSDKQYEGDGVDGDGFTQITVEPGTFENIGDMQFQAFDPDYPKGEFAAFTDAILRGLSAGLNVDHHSISNNMSGVNYSSARIAMLETRETWKALQDWFIRKLVKLVFYEWLERQILFQKISIPSRQGPRPLNRGFDYYKPATFTGRRWDWVDPQKEITAKQNALASRMCSLSSIIRERGDDPDEVLREIAEDEVKLRELGLTIAPQTPQEENASDSEE